MTVRVSSTRGNFWGLVEQKGPWKTTLTDLERSHQNVSGSQTGGGIQLGGTKNAGHAGWYASINPSLDPSAMPLPKPSRYVQQSIITPPQSIKRGAKGSILFNSPTEPMKSGSTKRSTNFQRSQQEATGGNEDLESIYTNLDTPQSNSQTPLSEPRNPFLPGPNLTNLLNLFPPASSPVYDENVVISPSTNSPSVYGTPTGVSPSVYGTPTGVSPSVYGTPTGVSPTVYETPAAVSPTVYGTPTGVSPSVYGTPQGTSPQSSLNMSLHYPSIPSTPTTPSSSVPSVVSNTPILFNEQGTSPMKNQPMTSDKNVGTNYPWNEIVSEFNNFREQWQATSDLLTQERQLTSAQSQEIQRLQQQAYQIDMMMTQLFDQAFPGKDWRSLVDQNRSLPQNLEMMWNTFSNDPELLKSIAKRMLTLTDKMKQVTDQGTQTSPQKKRPRPPRILTHFTRPSSTSDPNSSGSSYKPSATPSDDSNKGNYMDLDEPRRNIKRRVQLAKKKFQ